MINIRGDFVLTKYKKELRFLVVGGTSTLLDFIIYILLSSKIDVNISKLISMSISCIYSFFINKNWTFSNKDNINIILILKYILGQILNICINTLTNYFVYKICSFKIISFIIATIVAMIFNFLYQNYIVFKRKNAS